jgi:hypothetical protein
MGNKGNNRLPRPIEITVPIRVTVLISRLCLAGRGTFWRPRAIPTRRASRLAEMPKSRGGRIDITCSVENILNFTIFP